LYTIRTIRLNSIMNMVVKFANGKGLLPLGKPMELSVELIGERKAPDAVGSRLIPTSARELGHAVVVPELTLTGKAAVEEYEKMRTISAAATSLNGLTT